MPISQVIGILASLIGMTATLLGAWVYIRTKRPPKMELLSAGIVIVVILGSILGLAELISSKTDISINGQKTVPVPIVPVPGQQGPSQPGPSSTSTPSPSPTSTSSPSPTPASSPSPIQAPSLSPTPTSQPTPYPTSATPKTRER